LRTRRFPLGIDLGTYGIRICEIHGLQAEVRNIVTATLPTGYSEALLIKSLRDLLAELHSRERRCVMTLDERASVVRELALPPMSRFDRRRAAQIEARRFAPAQTAEVLSFPVAVNGLTAVVATAKDDIARLERIARGCGLKLAGIDHQAFALRRAHPEYQAILDVGYACSRFYAYGEGMPFMQWLDIGGMHFTQALAQSFSIDAESAERRKRMHGTGSTADTETQAIVSFVGRAMRAARQSGIPEIERILLCGGGARSTTLRERLMRDTGCIVASATDIANCSLPYPEDIVRAASSQWGLACGTALWSFSEEVAA
jgi:Tfp pilus assembly PilM family ATPase